MAQGAPTPPSPPDYPVSLEGCAPFLLLLSFAPVQLDWFSLVRRKGLPGGTKQRCAAPSSDWGATVSLEASRLLPSRLVGFLYLPPTFNHLFTAVTQRKVSPLEETQQTNLNLELFWGLFGVLQISRGGVGSLAGGDALPEMFSSKRNFLAPEAGEKGFPQARLSNC